MAKTTSLFLKLVALASFLTGCAGLHRGAPDFKSQVVSTASTLRLDIELSDRSNMNLLIGAEDNSDVADVPPSKDPRQFAAAAAQAGRTPVARVTYGQAETGEHSPAPVIEFGWIYVVRPPGWPVVRTPASRGGVPLGMEWNGTVRVAAAIDADVQRFFFLGAFNADGSAREVATLRVDDYPDHLSDPLSVDLAVGQYAEVTLVGTTLQITIGEFPVTDPRCPEEIRDLLKQIREDALDHLMPWNDGLVVP